MDAITMQKISSLVEWLKKDYLELRFEEANDFRWSPDEKTVWYCEEYENTELLTLHELAHAVLEHETYDRDVELVRIEAEAWGYVKMTLAPRYEVMFDESIAEEQIDTYRSWLHERSKCPTCLCNGWQTANGRYRCPSCQSEWKVAEAGKFNHIYRRRIK